MLLCSRRHLSPSGGLSLSVANAAANVPLYGCITDICVGCLLLKVVWPHIFPYFPDGCRVELFVGLFFV